MKIESRLTVSVVSAIFIWCVILYGIVCGPQLYSPESILNSTIDNVVFGGDWQTRRHVVPRYFSDEIMTGMPQHIRLDRIVQMLNVTVTTLNKAGLQTFLDAGSLLGYYRDGTPIPWDIDGDVAIIGEECLRKYPDQDVLLAKLRSLIPLPYHVENFACEFPPRDGRDFTGVITDTRNGFKIDVFTYHAVDTSDDGFSWRKGSEWLQRDDERGKHFRVSPKEAILPLQYGNFSSDTYWVAGNIIPSDPETHLRWDFGAVLAPHLYLQLSFYTEVSAVTVLGILLLLTISTDWLFNASAAATLLLLAGGFRVAGLIICLVFVQGNKKSSTSRFFQRLLSFLVLVLLLSDVSPIIPQAFDEFMELVGVPSYTVNPNRFCFLYKLLCVDS